MIDGEKEILDKAIEAFHKETNLKIDIGPQEVRQDNKVTDAIIRIDIQGKQTEYLGEVKTGNITTGQLIQLMMVNRDRVEDDKRRKLFVTRYVTPQMAMQLKQFDIQFIDTAGNTFINDPPIFIFIRGNKTEYQIYNKHKERMLGRTDVQVIFALLCNRELCNANYREIAEQAQVALGTVGWVVRDLTTQGYLVDADDKQRRLIRKKELLNKWLTTYTEKLRPKKLIGKFTPTKPDFWQQVELDRFNAQWGGEVAAYRMTRYLKPEIITIYTDKPAHELTLGLKLRQDKNGIVELRERFWKCNNPEIDKTMVPPLLVYADLMATGDTRNIETAHQIYIDYLQRYIEKD